MCEVFFFIFYFCVGSYLHFRHLQQEMVDALIESSGKTILLHKMLAKLKAKGHRVLLFCQVCMCVCVYVCVCVCVCV